MKDEIKEKIFNLRAYLGTEENWILTDIEDYITNLQEERDMYKGSFETMSKNYFEEKSRNEKAIEFVEQNLEGIGYVEVCDLLNILQGEDKDEQL